MFSKIAGRRVIVSLLATETQEVIADIILPYRGIIIHRKTQKEFPSAYLVGNDILIHPEYERAIMDQLRSSIEKDFDRLFLKGEM